MYVYLTGTLPHRHYQVGFYHPVTGEWIRESDHDLRSDAMARVSYLNGGFEPEQRQRAVPAHD